MLGLIKIKTQCAVCETNIWQYNGSKLKRSNEYNETDVVMSDGSTMTIGVCNKHVELKNDDLPIISEKVRQGWTEEVELGFGHRNWLEQKGTQLEATGVKS